MKGINKEAKAAFFFFFLILKNFGEFLSWSSRNESDRYPTEPQGELQRLLFIKAMLSTEI